ncbi:response regulator [Desulfofustis glycolicus]|uniref:histidine kinase n=1 Tax=Desulfofustis glycolicus DSM 9705 TaxID=1121409 RepID=A0A1M5V5U5_9BACT|nr:response regulator [Desulfofustis glycolicus]MCB2214971.1 response regulator [Desulfobulbaceae bacterium]SHH70601.1 PAS domain S-box-containing protein [Desulfofustis glycolicus DSM 9705]
MRILVVDDRQDSRYLLEVLFKGHGHQVLTASHGNEALEKLAGRDVELIISDILMPVMDGFQLCRQVKKDEALRHIPFIFYTATYTGPQDEALALQIGADRFLQKPCEPDILLGVVDDLVAAGSRASGTVPDPADEEELLVLYNERLVRKLEQKMVEAEREIEERKKVEVALRQSEQRLVAAQRLAAIGDFTWDVDSGQVRWSASLCELLGYDHFVNFNYRQINATVHHPDDVDRVSRWLKRCLDSGQERLTPHEYRVIRKDGATRFVRTVGTIERSSGNGPQVFATVQDITEQKQAEHRLQEAYQIINMSPAVAFLWKNAPGWPVEFVSDNVVDLFGYRVDEFLSGNVVYEAIIHEGDRARVVHEMKHVEQDRDIQECRLEPYRVVTKDGGIKWVDERSHVRRGQDGAVTHFQGIVIDITEARLIEAQLLQAQKMESIGRLAGGVAHDYNNMLSVIIGHAELALGKDIEDDSLRDDLQEILAAAGRSRDITRQLLAFARKDAIIPEVFDLNQGVATMLKVLRRLLGEDIDLVWMPGAELWPVRMDPAQLDQILANLCVNARDAIVDVGTITIETKRVTFDQAYCVDHIDFVPGDFVMLGVADDGCGMDRSTRERIFEPFFTTKETGRGTGLGLATVYGIVKQNEGFINVYSEPGEGTAFRIYLPRYRGDMAESVEVQEVQLPIGDKELILVVEDEAAIMKLTERILDSLNYRVITAQTVTAALKLMQRHGDELALLITDVVMPEMNGRDLANRLRSQCPHLTCLFMSGYTADVIAHRGVLEKDVHFIQKPFSRKDLACAVRQALAAR